MPSDESLFPKQELHNEQLKALAKQWADRYEGRKQAIPHYCPDIDDWGDAYGTVDHPLSATDCHACHGTGVLPKDFSDDIYEECGTCNGNGVIWS